MKLPRRKKNREGVTSYGSAHLQPFIGPWAAWAALPVAGTVTNAIAEASTPAGVAVGAVAAVGGFTLTAFTNHVYKARSESIRLHATATVAGASVWTLWTTAAGLWQTTEGHGWNVFGWVAGVFNPWPWGAWALLGPLACITWNIRRLSRAEADQATDQGGLLEKVKIAGRVRSTAVEAGGNRVRAELEVARGTHTINDVQQAIGNVASALGVRESAVRVIKDPNDNARGSLLVTPRDLLKETIHWPGPSAPGESIAEPIHVGRYEDGETAQLWLPGDASKQRNASHLAISGMSGAGKTESGLAMLGDAMTRRDIQVIYSDPVKGVQSCAAIAHGLGLLITDRDSAVAGLRGLKVAISAHTNQLGRCGFKQWTPQAALPVDQGGADLRLTVYWLEESAALIADSTTFTQLTEQARSAGIILVLSQQRLSHDRIDTSARANLGAMWCFGVRDDREKFGLSDTTFEAGAAPWDWKNGKPGYSYLEAAGVPEDRWSIPLRAYFTQAAELSEAVSEYANPTLSPITAQAFGSLYAKYQAQVAAGAAPWQTGTQTTVIAVQGLAQTAQTEADDDEETEEEDPIEHLDFPIPPQPEPGFCDDIDPEQEIPEDDDDPVEFAAPKPSKQVSTEEARAALLKLLRTMAERGDAEVNTRQLVEFRQFVGRKSPWLTKELRKLTDAGLITIEAGNGAYGLDPLRAKQLVGADA